MRGAAAEAGFPDVVAVVDEGVSLEERNGSRGEGVTALQLAAMNGARSVVNVWLDRGANPSATEIGKTGAALARSAGYQHVAKTIAQASAQPAK